ncbi:ABC transporter RzcB, putative [Cyanobium sp. PCC 7001]|uniref:ABC transporter transmembrane domain-containing protein n=1 Tax=Cyanobium sp. PCC 7001 TaxID=180281 RepID=UPI00018049C5|nr:ABC transporter transmembrane domain-containing protein [Cyanobium sp. PCC 7001]EDY37992.1 ABC transporter RzcB, putative [Cyanobium sp. PCC 7001]
MTTNPERGGTAASLGGLVQGFIHKLRSAFATSLDLIDELVHHRFFQSLRDVDWSAYQLGPILIASVLINLLELASPLYINIVYTSILPTGSMSSLVVLSVGVLLLMALGGWLKSVRLGLTGSDGARLQHQRRMEALIHFSHMRLSDYLSLSPAAHAERLNSINQLRDESSLQAVTTAIDLVFSLLFVLVLFLIAGSVGVVAVVAIVIYLLRALAFARQFEVFSKRRDLLELDRLGYQSKVMGAIDLIKSNGLGRQFLVGNEQRQEQLAWQRMVNSRFSGQQQAFSSLMSQFTLAGIVTWGAVLVIHGHLLVGALAAALLLGGKILSPWQQAMALWSSYRRLSHARDEYDALMAMPIEPEGGLEQPRLSSGSAVTISLARQPLVAIQGGSVTLLRDRNFGAEVRHLFFSLIQIEPDDQLMLNGLPIADYQREALREVIQFVDPARDFFEGTLLENITSFQPRTYQRRALFWSYLSGLDAQVRSLPNGYSTTVGTSVPTGLSKDVHQLFHVITALARSPQLLLIDLSDCAYGKDFIDGLERILRRTRGKTTVLINGAGRVLSSLSDQEVELTAAGGEVIA